MPDVVEKRTVADLGEWPYPKRQLVPLTEVVHDRLNVEVFRVENAGAINSAYQRTVGPARWEQELRFKALSAAYTWDAAEALGNESVEQFWTDALNPGLRVRWYLDRTGTAYVQSIEFRCATERLEPQATVVGSHAWWDVAFKLVPADETV